MDKLFAGLAASFISALAFVAYKHSRSFKPIANVLVWAAQLLLLAAGIWDSSAAFERTAIHTAVSNSKLVPTDSKLLVGTIIDQAREERGLPMGYILGFYVVFLAYLTILRFLPDILDLEDKDKPKSEQA